MKVFRSYGSTEHPSITGCLLDEPEAKRLATDGRALPGVEFRLDEEGQIISRGPDCFVGYTDPELTASVFDDDGWYRTGDVGVVDDEGYLTITDRISDIIIRGGENISAAEIEELLMGLDEVAEVCVVAEPDQRLGEHAAAVLRVRDGTDRAERGGPREASRLRPDWPARSGPRRSTRSRSSRAPPRARSRSSCSASSCGTGALAPPTRAESK